MVSQRGGAGEAKRRDPSVVKPRRTTGLRTPVLAISGIHPLGRLQHQPLDLNQSRIAANIAKLPELLRKS